MIIKRLSLHAAERMQQAGKESSPSKVIRTLDSLRNKGFRKPTKDMVGEYIVCEHGVWVIKDETVVTYISVKRLSKESSEALRAYETFFSKKK